MCNMIEILISLYIHHNYMKTNELIVITLLINVKCVDYNVTLVLIYYIMKLCMITNIILCIT